MAKSTKIPLQYPVEMDGAKLEELAMRRPLVRDLRAAQRAAGAGALPSDTEVRLFANLCEVPPDLFDKMDLGDYFRVQEVYQGFLSRGSTSAPPEPSSPTSSTRR